MDLSFGYVTVILEIILFFPTVILGNKSIPFEVFSVVIFIVAGPAVGFALWQIYFHIASFAQFDKDIFNIKYEFQREYERLRLVCDDKERAELDSLDGRHIFGNSTAIGLAIIGLYALGLVYPYLLSGHSTNCMYLMPDKDSIYFIRYIWLEARSKQKV